MNHTTSPVTGFRRRFRGNRLSAASLVLLVGPLPVHVSILHAASSAVPPAISISVSPDAPADTVVPADQATLTQAAEFAWEQFIAANWPAVVQTGAVNTRGVPNPASVFGDQSGPLVWHTYRSKVEMFTNNPPGTSYNSTTQSLQFDFDAAPQYPYQLSVSSGVSPAPASTAWINLDETTQIGLDQLFAGSTPLPYPSPTHNSQPQQIRYLAKVNRPYFNYVTANGLFNHGTDPNGVSYNQYLLNYRTAIATNQQPAAGNPIVQLPVGTVMVKSAWRLLGPNDQASHYHTTTVRFYEKNSSGQIVYYQEQNWGMIALHIVVKTPSAPAFIFATFEQADNIRLANGTSVEDADGNIVAAPSASSPTTPAIAHTDTPTQTTTTATGPFPDLPSSTDQRLFYRNLPPSLPTGPIAVNRRFEAIPPDIIAVNQAAHAAIAAYDTANGVTDSPWPYYKLVNVQAQPLQPADATTQPATYFQANSVVETDYTLGQFAGILISTGSESGQTSNFSGGQPAFNVHLPILGGSGYKAYNSGGCMGCHGNAQVAGTDFSFTLNEGPVLAPDVPVSDTQDIEALIGRYGVQPTAK